MSDTERSPTSGSKQNYKVGRVLEEYDLRSLDAELDEMWLGAESADSYSLRGLSNHINKQVLRTAMERADIDPLDGEIEETYRILRNDDIDQIVYQNTVHRLQREGIDVTSLERDFVTHQAVYTYLTKFRGVTRDQCNRNESDPDHMIRDQLTENAKELFESIRQEEQISLGDFELDVDVRIHCRSCTETYSLKDLLQRGGCACTEPHEQRETA
ncbi:rod-determining factor RdfA [Halobacterium sp. KA-6]|uniref:rod-determining factor RdfA n=1 Tax=Halobacterium sp. KA-6 TaxID=2896368 RepID=UPI001E2C31F9|nr:rod-determining factor RdfA [Halobacterium sp. KA-6]MCD2204036.1 hypothetical protein [Halobacterium sp. KA-6]